MQTPTLEGPHVRLEPLTPDQIVGSTRFLDLDLTHRTTELGHTWLAASSNNS